MLPITRILSAIDSLHHSMDFELLQQFGVSLGLGLLVGFQREWDHPHVAGIRSFAMIPPLGTLCLEFGGWIPAAGLIALAGLLATGSLIKFRAGKIVPGIITSTAALLMYMAGAIPIAGARDPKNHQFSC